MAKKKPVNGKAKGKRGELEWAAFCRSQGRRSRKPWLVTMRADDWFNLYQKWSEKQK